MYTLDPSLTLSTFVTGGTADAVRHVHVFAESPQVPEAAVSLPPALAPCPGVRHLRAPLRLQGVCPVQG